MLTLKLTFVSLVEEKCMKSLKRSIVLASSPPLMMQDFFTIIYIWYNFDWKIPILSMFYLMASLISVLSIRLLCNQMAMIIYMRWILITIFLV